MATKKAIHSPEEIAKKLEATGDYKILRRIQSHGDFSDLDRQNLPTLVILDFETTGLNYQKDKPIEIGLIRVEYDPISSTLGKVVDVYSAFEDPGYGLSDEITRVTGITNEMVHGKAFDDPLVESIISKANLVIAHNADFDRKFAEARFPFMASVPWGCSMRDVPWSNFGFPSKGLENIASKLGYFYDAHRAVVDCRATGVVLNSEIQSGLTALSCVLKAADQTSFRIWAVDAPYATKDMLKEAGYRWSDCQAIEKKAWCIEVLSDIGPQLDWLAQGIIAPRRRIYVERATSIDRFSERQSSGEWMNL